MSRYLIIKIAAIGDVIMALPMVEQIRKKDSCARISWVCGKNVQPILEHFDIDDIVTIDEKKLYKGSPIDRLCVVFKVWKKISFRKYDYIALGHADKKYKILTMFSKALNFKSFCHELKKMCPIPGRHHTDEYVSLLDNNILRQRISSAKLYIQLDNNLKQLIGHTRKTVVLTPGGAKNVGSDDFYRRWPIENYADLAKRLIDKKYKVIITGGNGDQWVSKYFEDMDVINLVGKTSIMSMIALFNHVECVVTHDSGPMHMAGLTKCKIIAIFGPTNPYEKIPVRDNVHVMWEPEKYACCPCYDGRFYAKCDDNICMKNISVEKIFNSVSLDYKEDNIEKNNNYNSIL